MLKKLPKSSKYNSQNCCISEPETRIVGAPDMYVDYGSMVNLSCVVARTEKPPEKVIW